MTGTFDRGIVLLTEVASHETESDGRFTDASIALSHIQRQVSLVPQHAFERHRGQVRIEEGAHHDDHMYVVCGVVGHASS